MEAYKAPSGSMMVIKRPEKLTAAAIAINAYSQLFLGFVFRGIMGLGFNIGVSCFKHEEIVCRKIPKENKNYCDRFAQIKVQEKQFIQYIDKAGV
jgi:hypothetical protein